MKEYRAVCFTGTPGSGKSTVVRQVAKITGMEILSVGNFWREKYENIAGCKPPFEEWWPHTSSRQNFEVTKEACCTTPKENKIGDLRYPFFLHGKDVVLVLIDADLDTRAARALKVEKYRGKTKAEIAIILNRRVADELEMGKQLFGGDYDFLNPKYYNLCFNSGVIGYEEIAKCVVAAMERPWDYL